LFAHGLRVSETGGFDVGLGDSLHRNGR